MSWQFILTDLNGTVFGELTNADSRQVALPHMRVPTAAATIPIWHDRAADVLNNDCLLKCYRTDPRTGGRVLAFHGPVVGCDENGSGDAQTIAITAAGPLWRLSKRILPGSVLIDATTGQSPGVTYASPASPLDLGTIAGNIITDCNGQDFTGISVGTITASRTGAYGPVFAKVAAEALAELSAGAGSFEWVITPTEPTNVAGIHGWPQIGVFSAAPIIGTNRLDAVFEYGTPRANVESYTRSLTRDGLLTHGYMSVQGWPDAPYKDTAGVIHTMISRTAANATTRGYFEEVVSDNGIIDDGIRGSLLDENITVRSNPRNVITFKPAVNTTPAPLTDYQVGDTVRARALVRGNLRFDALFRIWGVTFNIDSNGNESVELELVVP